MYGKYWRGGRSYWFSLQSFYFFYETRFFYILFLGADLSFDIELDDIDLDQLDKETVSEFILQWSSSCSHRYTYICMCIMGIGGHVHILFDKKQHRNLYDTRPRVAQCYRNSELASQFIEWKIRNFWIVHNVTETCKLLVNLLYYSGGFT